LLSIAALISAAIGCGSPVIDKQAPYSGSSDTAQSARFSKARIIAVERLRGPNHIAMRIGGVASSPVRFIGRAPSTESSAFLVP